jgi:hypothetical protein
MFLNIHFVRFHFDFHIVSTHSTACKTKPTASEVHAVIHMTGHHELKKRVVQFSIRGASSLTVYRPSRGTVADRIRRFQEASDVPTASTRPASTVPVDIPAAGLRSQSAFGHRKQDSFGPPATRASRDVPDGSRGDGHPPVGMPYPSTKFSPPLIPRAATSLAGKVTKSEDPFLTSSLPQPPARSQTTPSNREPETTTDLAGIRSRLKYVGQKTDQPRRDSTETRDTLAELGSMIDSAIVEQSNDNQHKQQRVDIEPVSPERTVVRPQRPGRSPRKSIDSATFSPPLRHPSRPRTGNVSRSPRKSWHQQGASPRQEPSLLSPVKYRAAIFESMQHHEDPQDTPCEAPHDRHIHVKKEWSVIPESEHGTGLEKELHSLKFGKTMYDRSEANESPRQSIERIKARGDTGDSSHESHGSFITAKTTVHSPVMSMADGGFQVLQAPQPERKTSLGWPFKWKSLRKGSSVPPVTDADPATATSERDSHYPPTRSSVVKSKVQELLKRDADEQVRRQSEIQNKKKSQSRRLSKVSSAEAKETTPSSPSASATPFPLLQATAQEQTDMVAGLEAISISKKEAPAFAYGSSGLKSPVQTSWAEKEVIEKSNQPHTKTARSATSTKQAPSTPVRGRPTQVRQSMSPRYSPYTSEQAFILSPVSSRSPSRGRDPVRVHRVEVEMRDSPERKARERGEKLMYVRTAAFEEEAA